MIKNKFVRLVLFFIFISFSLSGLFVGISMTETGSRWFVNWLIKTNDIPLTVKRVEGRLIDTITLYDLHYKDKKVNDISLNKLVFDWTFVSLFSYQAQINQIYMENMTYRYSDNEPDMPIELPELNFPPIPVAINVEQLNIKNINVVIDDVELAIQEIDSSLIVNEKELTFELKQLTSDQQQLSGYVVLNNNKQLVIDSTLNWKGELEQEAAEGILKLSGPQNNVVVSVQIDSVINTILNGKVNLKDQPYHSKLNGELTSKLFETYAEQLLINTPVIFNLNGNMDQISASMKTHAQLASGDAFTIKLETETVIPGAKHRNLSMNVNWKTLPDIDGNTHLSLKGQGDFEYVNQILKVDHELQAPSVFNVKGNVDFAKDIVDLSIQWDDVSVPFSADEIVNLHDGLLNAKGKLESLFVTAETDFLIREDSDVAIKNYDKVYAEGEINLLSDHPVNEIKGFLKASVPENLKGTIDSIHAIDFELRTEADSIRINANTGFKSEQLGPMNIDLTALWKDSILTVESTVIDIFDGKLESSGVLSFKEKIKGTFTLNGSNLNAGVIKPDLVSKLDIDAGVTLSEAESGISTEIDLKSLSGIWRGFPLNSSARLTYVDDTYNIEKLSIKSGNNTAEVNLNVDKSLSGFIDLSIQDLSLFSSELGGEIKGRMDVRGNIDAPNIIGQLKGKNIIVDDVRIASLTSESNIDLRAKQHSMIKLELTSLKYQDYLFDSVFVNGEGLTESHKFEILASGLDLDVNAIVDASLKDKKWSGQFSQVELSHNVTGSWSLSSPSKYIWFGQDKQFNLEKTCIFQSTAHLCVVATGNADNVVIGRVDINHLPIKLIEPLINENILLKGQVSGNVDFNLLADKWLLTSNLKGSDVQIASMYDEQPDYIDINVVIFNLNANKNERSVDIQLSATEYFNVSLIGSMQNKSDRPIQGKLDLLINDIEWLQNIEPTLSGSHGKFHATVNATGTIQQPRIKGSFSLHNGLLNVVPIGLSLNKVEGQIQSTNAISQVRIKSLVSSDNKELLLNGTIDLTPEKKYPYEFNVSGDEFPIVRTADVTMNVSPNINLFGTKELHNIRGQLTVPLLDMLVSSLPESAVSVSPDTVVIQSRQADAVHVSNGNGGSDYIKNNIDIDMNVFLKPNIHIQGLGMDTRLTGDIRVTKPLGVYQPRGEGQVKLSDGRYRAYGQDLEIENGRLLFAGPLDNPAINLRAYRPKLSVKAGVSISGDVRRPKISLFSEPIQTEADTLSYIITGGPISGASGEEASLIAQAALSLGTQESSVLTNQIRDLFGLDDFSIGGGNTVASTSVSASKRLSQKLTFKSSFNPFDQLWAFFLNYKLTDNWSVQTESGVSQGADIVYSIESNSWSDLYKKFIDILSFN